MVKIGDEIREWASHAMVSKHMDFRELAAIADRTDREMVELPKDADGVPIHVGDTVYGCRSGMKMTISMLRMTTNGWFISTSGGYITDTTVTHTQSDSWERIAAELEEWSEDNRVNGSGEVFDRARGFSDRIRKLAKSGDKR